MAQPELIKIPRASDRTIVSFFKRLSDKYEIQGPHVAAYGGASISAVDLSAPTGDFETLLGFNSHLISTMSASISGLTIAFYRGGYPSGSPPFEKSPIYDEIALTLNASQGHVENTDKLWIVAQISNSLNAFESERPAVTGYSKEQSDLIAIHNATLERLESLSEDLIRQTSEYRLELDKNAVEKAEQLATAFDERKSELDSRIAAEVQKLDKRESALDERQKQIDDRNNTHVRRELRMAILDEVKSRSAQFNLTKGTQRLRLPLHVACLVIFSVAAVFSYFYSTQLFSYLQSDTPSTVNSVLLSLKSLGFTALAATTGVFYVRWLNRWFSQHADAEFRLKQFQLDVDRASWVVETVLEMKAGKDVMPTALLQSITRNLFEYDQTRSDEETHPADELASALIGTASSVRVRAGDTGEIEFRGKDLRKEMKPSKSD